MALISSVDFDGGDWEGIIPRVLTSLGKGELLSATQPQRLVTTLVMVNGMCVHVRTCACVSMNVCVSVFVCACVCVCAFVYVHVLVCTFHGIATMLSCRSPFPVGLAGPQTTVCLRAHVCE